jgi:hypothetical protein
MMHDIISDVLASPTIPRDRKREVIVQQLEEFRSPVGNVLSMEEWRGMADHMGGVAAMGGPAVGPRPPGGDTGAADSAAVHHHH